MKQIKQRGEFARWLALQSATERRVLARGWHVDPEADAAQLAEAILQPERVQAQWEGMGDEMRTALSHLLAAGGSLPVAILQREHGPVREPGNFPNPRSYMEALASPASPAERLFLLGLIVRHHDDRGQIFRVPQDFIELLPTVSPPPRELHLAERQPDVGELRSGDSAGVERMVRLLLNLAYEGELQTLDDGALNKASLVKIAKHRDPKAKLQGVRREVDWPWLSWVRMLTVHAGLLRRTTDGLLNVTPAALDWLKAAPTARIKQLLDGWVASPLDELTLLAGLRWRSTAFTLNLPMARRTLLALFGTLPVGGWFSFSDLVAAVRRVDPYFLRRDGRFDTWLLYDRAGKLLSGEVHWPEVEGIFIQFVAGYILNELGLTDIAPSDNVDAAMLRLTPTGAHLLCGAPMPPAPPIEPLVVQGTFEVVCSPGASPFARFQLARIAELVRDDEVAIFKLTRKSLLRAAERGISADDALKFLDEWSSTGVPSAVAYRVREWSGQAGQVVLESATLLRADPVLLTEIRRAKGIQLSQVEELRPDVWRVPDGDAAALLERLRASGFGVTDALASPTLPLSEHDLKALVTAAYAYAHLCADLGRPSEVSSSMLMRLRKLVPSRHADAAYMAARELCEQIKRDE